MDSNDLSNLFAHEVIAEQILAEGTRVVLRELVDAVHGTLVHLVDNGSGAKAA